jgi:hypothetical protein
LVALANFKRWSGGSISSALEEQCHRVGRPIHGPIRLLVDASNDHQAA